MRKFNKVLITGVTGFVGSHLAEYILQNNLASEVVGLARWRSRFDNILHIKDRLKIEWGDLLDLPSLRRLLIKHKSDVIFHLAAQSYVDFSFIAPIATLEANVIGTANLLEAVKESKLTENFDPVIHICSSSEVYGQVKKVELPINEDAPFRPTSPYAVSKVAEDLLALQYFQSWGIKTIRTRAFSHEGPRRGEVFAPSNFAKQIASIEAGHTKNVVYVGNLNSVRTFMDVRDAVRAYWQLVTKCSFGEVYNIGGVETMTIGGMLNKLISQSTRKDIRIKVDKNRLRPSDVTLQIPSIKKFKKATGWKTEIAFDKTLLDLLNFWRDYYKIRE